MALRRCFSLVKPFLEERLHMFQPRYLEVIDESWMHRVGNDTHFKILIVSDKFEGVNSITREYLVSKEIREAWNKGAIMISIVTQTATEYNNYKSKPIFFEYPPQLNEETKTS